MVAQDLFLLEEVTMSSYGQEDFKALNTDYFRGQWFSTEKDPDVLLSQRENITKLRMLSTWLIRNNFMADSSREAVVNHVCGDQVIVKPMYRRKLHKGLARKLNRDLAQVNKSRDISLPEILRQVAGMSFEKGDCLVNITLNPKVEKGLKTYVEVIDGGRIKNPPAYRKDPSVIEGIKTVDGIAVGAFVRKLQDANRIYTTRSERDEDFVYLPFFREADVDGEKVVRRVALLVKNGKFCPADQTRGIPPLTSATPLHRYFEDYLNTTLINKRTSGGIAGFIQSTNSNETADNLLVSGRNQNDMNVRGMLAPGMIASLKPGETLQPFIPRPASEGDDMFIKRILRLTGMPMQIPYEILHQDLKDVNYSSWKGGQLKMERSLIGWDIWATKVARLVVSSVLFEYYMMGDTNIKPDDIDLYIKAPRSSILDPEKDARGEKTELTNETTSIHDIHDRRGTDYDSTRSERIDEALDKVEEDALVLVKRKELEAKYGIEFPETVQANAKQDRQGGTRKGEKVDKNGEVDEDTKKERRKDDGNW